MTTVSLTLNHKIEISLMQRSRGRTCERAAFGGGETNMLGYHSVFSIAVSCAMRIAHSTYHNILKQSVCGLDRAWKSAILVLLSELLGQV